MRRAEPPSLEAVSHEIDELKAQNDLVLRLLGTVLTSVEDIKKDTKTAKHVGTSSSVERAPRRHQPRGPSVERHIDTTTRNFFSSKSSAALLRDAQVMVSKVRRPTMLHGEGRRPSSLRFNKKKTKANWSNALARS
tara:strand:+ start:111 stop:518 length:408 start_codon:yes stop_codon:yes gene_type:complete